MEFITHIIENLDDVNILWDMVILIDLPCLILRPYVSQSFALRLLVLRFFVLRAFVIAPFFLTFF